MLRWTLRSLVLGLSISALLVIPLRWLNPPTTSFILQDPNAEPLRWTRWSALGTAAPIAVVASEDQNFATHHGFDLAAIQAAISKHEQGASLRGASTISQQVAKNLYLWPGRNFVRKGLEAYFTTWIELCWSKRRILEVYLNVAEFGPGIYGVGNAGHEFFGKPVNGFTDADAALLAAVLPNPKRLSAAAPSDYVQQRQRWILEQMQRLRREGWITQL